MTALGIGVRVYVGWIPPIPAEEAFGAQNPRHQTGTIVDGPVPPLTRWKDYYSQLEEWGWEVQLDNGKDPIIVERFLFPIDDWDEDIKEEKEKESPKQLEIVR